MNTQEIAWAEEISQRLVNLEKNQVSLMTLSDKIIKLESKQANLINDIKKLKKKPKEKKEEYSDDWKRGYSDASRYYHRLISRYYS